MIEVSKIGMQRTRTKWKLIVDLIVGCLATLQVTRWSVREEMVDLLQDVSLWTKPSAERCFILVRVDVCLRWSMLWWMRCQSVQLVACSLRGHFVEPKNLLKQRCSIGLDFFPHPPTLIHRLLYGCFLVQSTSSAYSAWCELFWWEFQWNFGGRQYFAATIFLLSPCMPRLHSIKGPFKLVLGGILVNPPRSRTGRTEFKLIERIPDQLQGQFKFYRDEGPVFRPLPSWLEATPREHGGRCTARESTFAWSSSLCPQLRTWVTLSKRFVPSDNCLITQHNLYKNFTRGYHCVNRIDQKVLPIVLWDRYIFIFWSVKDWCHSIMPIYKDSIWKKLPTDCTGCCSSISTWLPPSWLR